MGSVYFGLHLPRGSARSGDRSGDKHLQQPLRGVGGSGLRTNLEILFCGHAMPLAPFCERKRLAQM